MNVNGGVYVDDTGVSQSSPTSNVSSVEKWIGDRFLEPALGDRLFVHRQRARAAFARAAAVIGEVEANCATASGQRFRGGNEARPRLALCEQQNRGHAREPVAGSWFRTC